MGLELTGKPIGTDPPPSGDDVAEIQARNAGKLAHLRMLGLIIILAVALVAGVAALVAMVLTDKLDGGVISHTLVGLVSTAISLLVTFARNGNGNGNASTQGVSL